MKVSNLLTKTSEIDRISGAVLGFMIGDALGLPVSGMTEEQIKNSVGYIRHYKVNSNHPFFYYF